MDMLDIAVNLKNIALKYRTAGARDVGKRKKRTVSGFLGIKPKREKIGQPATMFRQAERYMAKKKKKG